jgi:hypothetical protein
MALWLVLGGATMAARAIRCGARTAGVRRGHCDHGSFDGEYGGEKMGATVLPGKGGGPTRIP